MPPLPKQREELFSQNCARGMPAVHAYVAAGYKPNLGNPFRLKEKERIKKRITEIQQSFHGRTVSKTHLEASAFRDRLVLDQSDICYAL